MYQLSVYAATNALKQNETYNKYQDSYIIQRWGAILRGL
jgi:hypothetical protein